MSTHNPKHLHAKRLLPLAVWAVLLVGLGLMGLARAEATTKLKGPSQPNAGPDLVPFVEWSPLRPTVSDTLVITYGVTNIGDAPAVPTDDVVTQFYFGLAQTPTLSTPLSHLLNDGVPIGVGQRRSIGVRDDRFAITRSQAVSVWVWADFTNEIAEGNEANNLVHAVIQPALPAGVDSYENDGDCSQAKLIQMNVPQAHNHWPVDDEDWVAFSADANRTYLISAQNNGRDAFPMFEVLLGCNAPPSLNSPNVALVTGTQVIWNALVSGTAYIRTRHRENTHGPATAYTLTVTPSEVCYSEPNNTCHTSTPIIVDGNVSKQANFCQTHHTPQSQDLDWYAFEGKAGISYKIKVSSDAPNVKPRIARIEPGSCGDAPQFGDGHERTYDVDRDGPVHVLIENRDSAFGVNSDYFITITVAGCVPDDHESNNSANEKRAIQVNEVVHGNGCPAHDEDWYFFVAQPNVIYTIETMPLQAGEDQGDTKLTLYDSEGRNVLRSDDDSGPGLGALTQISVSQAVTVNIKVAQFDPASAGPSTAYMLSVRDKPCVPDAQEPNNIPTIASRLISGTASVNTLCPASDEDWFIFTVPAGTYSLSTSDLGVAAGTTLALYDATGTVQLQFNDDYQPKGLGSRLVFSTTTSAAFRALIRPRATSSASTATKTAGQHYTLLLQTESPLAGIELTPDTVLLNPEPTSSAVNTLIVTNRAKLEAVFGAPQATLVMTTLQALSLHNRVAGEVIDLNANDTVRAAYADWAANPNSTAHANAVAQTIRNLIIDDIGRRRSIQYLVIVGDDRIVPFHRLADASSKYPESWYTYTVPGTSVGHAQRDNTFLTDDCYSAAQLVQRTRAGWCVPLLATGRLVETPDDIVRFITRFLTRSQITPIAPNMALVGGFDFAKATAEYTCDKLRLRFGAAQVNCTLIGDGTSLARHRELQLDTKPSFLLQSFHGHGTHFAFAVNKNSELITVNEIALSPNTPEEGWGLVWSPACHVGLSVPDVGGPNTLDFAQVYLRRGTNLIANTGYGWGNKGGTAYSEYLVQYLVDALTRENDVQIGPALRRAKLKYYTQQPGDDVLHPKVAMLMTLYGLPMMSLHTNSPTNQPQRPTTEDEFPSMITSANVPAVTLPGANFVSAVESIRFVANAAPSALLSRSSDESGTTFALDGRVAYALGESVQPRFYYTLTRPDAATPARSAWILSATYETVRGITATLTTATNEHGSTQTAATDGWDNSDFVAVRTLPGQDTLIALMGQGNRDVQQIRLTRAMSVEVYYSNIQDLEPPHLISLDIERQSEQYALKAKISDTNAITRVGVLYTNGEGAWHTQDLHFDESIKSWVGSVRESGEVSFAVQALDSAGNVSRFTNKGRYFAAAEPVNTSVYLPLVAMPLE
jgi:hypothetical protein